MNYITKKSVYLSDLYQKFSQKYESYRVGAGSSAVVFFNDLMYFVIDPKKFWSRLDKIKPEYVITFGCAGGTVENDESFIEALFRELQEEMQITADIINPEITYYITSQGQRDKVELQDDFRPLAVYEHQFESPEKGSSFYLIAIYLVLTMHKPNPSSEIPGIFGTDLKGFYSFQKPVSLRYFHNNYEIISQTLIPSNGTISSYQSPKILLDHFIDILKNISQA